VSKHAALHRNRASYADARLRAVIDGGDAAVARRDHGRGRVGLM